MMTVVSPGEEARDELSESCELQMSNHMVFLYL